MSQVSPKLVAHRGYPDRYPENTLTGFQAAIDAGARYIEFDVQMTADQQFVVIHDDDLRRTAGIALSVFDADLATLQTISVHEPDRFADKYEPCFIASLVAVMEQIQQYDEVTAFVELKQESIDRWGLPEVVSALLDVIQTYARQCILISYNHEALAYARQQSDIRTGWVLQRYDASHRAIAERLQADYLICNQSKVADEQQLWPDLGSWMLYGVETPELVSTWTQRGVAYLETDCIGQLLET